ncbi:MAG: hypothetical protein K8S94_14155 [Planctomycetia bacterium]|nr:hypothetical protein [Planctomycetia bacterium]
MRIARQLVPVALALAVLFLSGSAAEARSPRNPYSSFNLSGVNYGAQQWDRAQRQGKRVWPYYNTPSGSYRQGGTVGVVGGSGGVIGARRSQSGGRWRR